MTIITDYAAFDVGDYLAEYYADVGPENQALLDFLVRALSGAPQGGLMLDFGGGPTVYSLIAAAERMGEMHIAEYAPANREQVRHWLEGDAAAFDWHAFTRTILELEGLAPSAANVLAREALTRQRVTRVMSCDAHQGCPVDGIDRPYDVLTTHFCAEAAARDRAQWLQCMHHITSLLRPGGQIVLSAVKGADSYGVGSSTFLAVNLLEDDLVEMLLDTGFVRESIRVASVPADRPDRHYQGLMFARATKSK